MESKKALLMLSGGRDSLLAGCRAIANGYKIYMICYDNGRMSHAQNSSIAAQKIINRFGEEHAAYLGVRLMAQSIRPLLAASLHKRVFDLCKEYPDLLMSQLQCLACHSAMYVHSIALSKVHGFDAIVEGARKQQLFFVELPEMKERYEKLCKEYDIELVLPVYDLDSDQERKDELSDWGILPKTYEPQCWIGCPMEGALTDSERNSLCKYFDQEMLPILRKQIDGLINKASISYPEDSNTNIFF